MELLIKAIKIIKISDSFLWNFESLELCFYWTNIPRVESKGTKIASFYKRTVRYHKIQNDYFNLLSTEPETFGFLFLLFEKQRHYKGCQ